MNQTDEKVIENILAGNREAYAFLVDRYKDKVFALVMGVLKDYELAQEVAQDVFVKAYVSLNKFRKDASFSTWLYRISYNTAISETRKKKVHKIDFNENVSAEISWENEDELKESLNKEEDQLRLSKAIEELLPDEKHIINMYYFEEKTISEICEITGLSQSNAKVKLYRLRKKLKELIIKFNKKELVTY
jgi:RNA polymerase sigma-70 factor (ECF subfamily)